MSAAVKVHAYCPDCRSRAVPVTRGLYGVHRRSLPTTRTRDSHTERCPGSRKDASPEDIARWVVWETESAARAADYSAKRLTDARESLARAEVADAEARKALAAIVAYAAQIGVTP